MDIYFIRHGEPDSGLDVFCSKDECILTEKGKRQALLTGGILKERGVTKLISSSIVRAKETTDIISSELDLSVLIMDEFREYDFGEWKGISFNKIVQEFPAEFDVWSKDPESFIAPNGESYGDFRARVVKGLDKVRGDFSKEDVISITAHGGVIRCVISLVMDISIKETWNLLIDHCGITQLSEFDGKLFCKSINNTFHLNTV